MGHVQIICIVSKLAKWKKGDNETLAVFDFRLGGLEIWGCHLWRGPHGEYHTQLPQGRRRPIHFRDDDLARAVTAAALAAYASKYPGSALVPMPRNSGEGGAAERAFPFAL